MARCLSLLLWATSATATVLRPLQQGDHGAADKVHKADGCEKDDIAFAKMTSMTCVVNWALKGERPWSDLTPIGCWDMLAYNTDTFFSSTVYQNRQDKRCSLVFSGYHGALAGYIRGALSLVTPLTTWKLCGYDMYAPYVRLLRHHTSLGNWSKLTRLLAGPESTCKGEINFMAESMGGSSGEILAACANQGMIDQLQSKSATPFKLQNLYTFGAPAASKQAIKNSLRKDGCFQGKRFFFASDVIAHLGSAVSLHHPNMDAVELWPQKTGPTLKAWRCGSPESRNDGIHPVPPPLKTEDRPLFRGNVNDQHMITSYDDNLVWLNQAGGVDDVLGMEPIENSNSVRYADMFLR